MTFEDLLQWGPWLVTAIFFADKAIAALRRLMAAPAELRTNILLRAEKIHAEQMQEAAETRLAARAEELIGLLQKVSDLEKLLAEALALLRPNGGMSLYDRITKLDKDFRDSIEDTQRWRREVMRQLEGATQDGDPA